MYGCVPACLSPSSALPAWLYPPGRPAPGPCRSSAAFFRGQQFLPASTAAGPYTARFQYRRSIPRITLAGLDQLGRVGKGLDPGNGRFRGISGGRKARKPAPAGTFRVSGLKGLPRHTVIPFRYPLRMRITQCSSDTRGALGNTD